MYYAIFKSNGKQIKRSQKATARLLANAG